MKMLVVPEMSGYSAIESGEKVSFRQLHRDCKCRIQQKLFCPTCNKDILDKTVEIVKGYENGKDEYLVLTKEEIESCKKESNNVIEVIQFVNEGDIPVIYHESAMYLTASKSGIPTFGLICQTMTELNKVALGKVVIREKDHFLAIKPYNGILIAYDLYFPNEIRETTELQNPKFQESLFDAETRELAKKLISNMSRAFDPSKIKDEYTAGLREIITAKAEGRQIAVEEVREAKTVLSLKDALAGSLDEAVNF